MAPPCRPRRCKGARSYRTAARPRRCRSRPPSRTSWSGSSRCRSAPRHASRCPPRSWRAVTSIRCKRDSPRTKSAASAASRFLLAVSTGRGGDPVIRVAKIIRRFFSARPEWPKVVKSVREISSSTVRKCRLIQMAEATRPNAKPATPAIRAPRKGPRETKTVRSSATMSGTRFRSQIL